MIPHNNVVSLFRAAEGRFQFQARDVWTLFHSFAFDFSIWEMWGALLYGGCLVIVPFWVSRSPKAFYALLYQERVTILNQTPSAFSQLVQEEEANAHVYHLALRLIILGGEAIHLPSVQTWFARHGDRHPQIINMYGITETTVHVTCYEMTLADVQLAAVQKNLSSPIGKPLSHLQVYVFDESLQPVPVGTPGEMYVGGAGLARDYLRRPEINAERFIPHPFSTQHGERLYRTGDLACYLPDGSLSYLGRNDQQVKIRGFRIELGEIEAVLTRHPAIRDAVVVLKEQDQGDRLLIAYLVTDQQSEQAAKWSNTDLLSNNVREYLQERLPAYMIPAIFVPLDALPLTASGKIDRRALPAVSRGRSGRGDIFVAPQTSIEERLAQIWCRVLDAPLVGIYDDFFKLGGHSLLAVQVIAHVFDEIQINIPIAGFFEKPTIVEMAKYIEKEFQEGREIQRVAIARMARDGELPLTFIQEQVWFLQQLNPDNVSWNGRGVFRFRGKLDVVALEASLNEIIRRHEILRTTFPAIDGRPMQIIYPSYKIDLVG